MMLKFTNKCCLIFKRDSALVFLITITMVLLLALKPVIFAPPSIQANDDRTRFNSLRAMNRLENILGNEKPHPVDTKENDLVRERIVKEIQKLDYQHVIRDDLSCNSTKKDFVSCARVRNVIFHAGPLSTINLEDGNSILVVAHYDSIPAGPGASDDGIGIASLLELASILSRHRTSRPVIFLMTDGEEAGLLGASSFIRTDPLAQAVADVINIDARGTRGPAFMFESSQPNAYPIRNYAAKADRPASNSFMNDIYRVLPSNTDLTVFLSNGFRGLNFGLAGGSELYHTELDNLKNIEPRSLQHIGDLTLSTLLNLLNAPNESEGPKNTKMNVAFTNILTHFTIILPEPMSLILNIFGFFVATILFFSFRSYDFWHYLLAPPLSILIAITLTILIQFIMSVFRTELIFWVAHPIIWQMLSYLVGILSVTMVLYLIPSQRCRLRLNYSTWLWISVIGLLASWKLPGAGILFAVPIGTYLVFTLATYSFNKHSVWPSKVAGVCLMLTLLPNVYLIETVFGFIAAPVIAALCCFVFLLMFSFSANQEIHPSTTLVSVLFLLTLVTIVTAASVPAYTQARPGLMNVVYQVDIDDRKANFLIESNDPNAYLSFGKNTDKSQTSNLIEAIFEESFIPNTEIISDTSKSGIREINLGIAPDNADVITLEIIKSPDLLAIIINDIRYETISKPSFEVDDESELFTIVCRGRSCAQLEITALMVESTFLKIIVTGEKFGLPLSQKNIVNNRSNHYVQWGDGDRTEVIQSKVL